MIYLASIVETDDKIYFLDVREQEDNVYYDTEKFIVLSKNVYLYIKDKLDSVVNTSQILFVYVDKPIDAYVKNPVDESSISLTPEGEETSETTEETTVEPAEPYIYIDDISIIKEDDIQKNTLVSGGSIEELKNIYKMRASNLLTSHLQMYPIKLFRYMKANAYLNANGYFITDDNRDDIYLKIVNSEDEKLVDMLLKFLDANDYLTSEDSILDTYTNFINEISSCTTKDEIAETYTKFFNEYANH